MNVSIPHNGLLESPHKEPDGSEAPFYYFAGIVIAIFLVACGMVSLIRYWRWSARSKYAIQRGVDLPDPWKGFWGWQ
jgi:hypothetical protein